METAADDLSGDVTALATLAHDDPRRALEIGSRLLARSDLDGAARVSALRAMASAAWLAGTIAESMAYANEALALARQLGVPVRIVEATITLAGCQALGGDIDGALATLDSVAGADAATTATLGFQRLAVMLRAGRHVEAITAATQALAAYRRLGDDAMIAHCHANRGYALLELGVLADAEKDLVEAERRYAELGLRARAAYATHNLGILAHRFGDLPLALARYRASEALLEELTESTLEVQVSRCQTLLSAGLLEEAAELGRLIRAEMHRLGLALDEAEAAMVVAQAQSMLGDDAGAAESALDAVALFEAQGRSVWADRARLVGWTAGCRAGQDVDITAVGRLASRLERSGLGTVLAETRLLEAECSLDRGETEAARRALQRVTGTVPLEVRLRERLVTAQVRLASHDRRGAAAAVRSGLGRLERHRATLAATELRAAGRRHGEELARLGLSLGLQTGGARAVLRWLERLRATALLAQPVRPPPDPELRRALADLRRVDQELRRSTTDDAGLRRHEAALRSEVIARARERRTDPTDVGPISPDLDHLLASVGDRALVEMEILDRRLVSVVVRRGRVERLPDVDARVIVGLGQSLAGALRRVMLGRRPAAAWAGASAIANDLDDQLALRRLDAEQVVLVPPATLQGLPWAALPSLASRQIVVAPSATVWAAAEVGGPAPRRTVVVAGPDLEHGRAEAAAVARVWPRSTVMVGDDARVERVLRELRGVGVAHLVCHGRFSPENALFSAVRLADGELIVYELEDVVPPPRTIVLSSCEAGVVSDRPGAELLGLTGALLSTGTRSLVAPVTIVPDMASTVDAMVRLHERLAAGDGPAGALVACRREAHGDPVASATLAAYACFGRGEVSPRGSVASP